MVEPVQGVPKGPVQPKAPFAEARDHVAVLVVAPEAGAHAEPEAAGGPVRERVVAQLHRAEELSRELQLVPTQERQPGGGAQGEGDEASKGGAPAAEGPWAEAPVAEAPGARALGSAEQPGARGGADHPRDGARGDEPPHAEPRDQGAPGSHGDERNPRR